MMLSYGRGGGIPYLRVNHGGWEREFIRCWMRKGEEVWIQLVGRVRRDCKEDDHLVEEPNIVGENIPIKCRKERPQP